MIFWNRKIGIAAVLTLTFGGLVALSTGTLLFLSIMNALDSTKSILASRLEALIHDAALESQGFFQPLEQQADWIANEIVAGRINPEKKDEFRAVLNGSVATLPQVKAISYQYPDGSGYFYDTQSGEMHSVNWPQAWQVPLNQSATNPQLSPSKDGFWVLRPSVMDGEGDTTFIFPARTQTGDLGVVGIRVNLSSLSRALAADATFRGQNLVRFLLFNDRIVIGHPFLKTMDDINRPTINEVNDPFLEELFDAERYSLLIVDDIDNVETFGINTSAGERIFAVMKDETRRSGGTISIGVHFDPDTGSAELNRLITSAIIGVILLLGSVIIAFILGRRAAAPMKQLAYTAQLVQNNKLDEVEPLPVGKIRELASAASAFNEMVIGLKERIKIRDLFGKYVPQDVATLLLTDDSSAEPKNAEATVLFLDIVGFSTISEQLSPKQIVDTMNAFFSDAVEIIETEEGMVTQYQGDAILAVFNVPLSIDNHALSAVKSAISILEKIKDKDYEGQSLKCRIGINTGPLVAGAIGAKDRLNYTVYGDAVNIAARLEQLNKEYGTELLVTEETAKKISDIEFEKIGTVPIRGRNKPVNVYTIKGGD